VEFWLSEIDGEIMTNTIKNHFYFLAGILFLALAKAKSLIQGYASPKPFAICETSKCIKYDIGVVNEWIFHLQKYTNNGIGCNLNGKRVLELGPGSDLGVGLYLLSKGAEEYNAVDINNLVQTVPDAFYEELFLYLAENNSNVDTHFLRKELDRTKTGSNEKLNYVCRSDFSISSALDDRKVDLVFSQAAFEHFDDIDKTIESLSHVVTKGSIVIILIDLKTHSRWIRDKDPLNIYRYQEWLYNLFNFSGIPNRVRPYQYKHTFEKYGFGNITTEPDEVLPSSRVNFVKPFLISIDI